MNFKDLANKAQSFANSPQGRKMIRQATDAVGRRSRGTSSGTGGSSVDRVLGAVRRFTDRGDGHPGGSTRNDGPEAPRR